MYNGFEFLEAIPIKQQRRNQLRAAIILEHRALEKHYMNFLKVSKCSQQSSSSSFFVGCVTVMYCQNRGVKIDTRGVVK